MTQELTMKTTIALLAGVAALAASPALALAVNAPEIDAGSGIAALAALGASIALLRERFKG